MQTTPRLIPFQAQHLLALSFRDGDRRETIRSAVRHETEGPAYTAIGDGMILGCAGVALAWPGVGCAWAVLTDDLMKKFPIWTTRTIRYFINDARRAFNLHRLEMVALSHNVRWAAALGFVPEQDSTARAFTADRRDAVRLEMTWLS